MAVELAFPTVDAASDSEDDYLVSTFRPKSRARATPTPSAPLSKKLDKPNDKVKPGSFRALGLSEPVCDALSKAGYGFPTSVQRRTIPAVLGGRDVAVMARTGAGKTASFLAPLLDRLSIPISLSERANGPRALVMAPTRELALQTYKFFRLYTSGVPSPPRAAVLVGGTPIDAQFDALVVCPELLICTPGRCLQLLAEMGRGRAALTLTTAETVVFDEADRLFEGTLLQETNALLQQLGTNPNRQTILVSATMPSALVEFSRTGLRVNAEVVRMDAHDALPPTLAVAFVSVRGRDEKDAALLITLRRALESDITTLVFAATHCSVEYIVALIRETLKCSVDSVHGNMDQGARVEAVTRFRKHNSKVLVVTDVAARGIDLPQLDLVLNYDFPATPKLFVHRVGRAARAGRDGRAISIISSDETPYMLDTHLFLSRGVQVADEENGSEAWCNMKKALGSSFLFGELPKAPLDEEVELLRKVIENIDISKLRHSAKNAQGLYLRTRTVSSGESVARTKAMFRDEQGGRKRLNVHPWFKDMESEVENKASLMAAELASWRPTNGAVQVPQTLRERKRRRDMRKALENARDKAPDVAEDDELAMPSAKGTVDLSSKEAKEKLASCQREPKRAKKRARLLAAEEQKNSFFIPLQRTASSNKAEDGVDEGFAAFRAIQSAAMDLNADSNLDLLRSNHSNKHGYWDRERKRFVKGGAVSERTSKTKNMHVASREARAKAKANGAALDYSLGDGVMYKKWLAKNKKAVEQRREAIDNGEESRVVTVRANGVQNGIGANDFRKGAYGRRLRIAAAGRAKLAAQGSGSKGATATGVNELKTAEEIKKERKMKRKAELRKMTKEERKRRGKARAKASGGGGPRNAAGGGLGPKSSKVRIIKRGR